MDTLVGTSGNDTFIGTDTSLTAGDVLNGGSGADTFNFYQVSTQTAGTSVGPALSVSGIETLNVFDSAVNASTSKALTIDASVFSGLTNVNVTNTGTLATVTLDKLNKAVTAGLSGQQAGAETFSYNGVAATDTIKLALSGVYGTSSTTAASLTLGTGTGAATTDVAPTLVSLSGTGGNVILLDNAITTYTSTTTGATTLAIDGTTSSAYPTIKTIDFSGSTGNNTVDIAATGGSTAAPTASSGVGFASAGFTFKGGSGNDTLRLTMSEAGNYASTWSVDGGAGTDTLALYTPSAATTNATGTAATVSTTVTSLVNKLTNFETLSLISRDTGSLATGNSVVGYSIAANTFTGVSNFSFSSSFTTAATSGVNAMVGLAAVGTAGTGNVAASAITVTGQANANAFTLAGKITGGAGATTATFSGSGTGKDAIVVTPLIDNGTNSLTLTLSAATLTGGASSATSAAAGNALDATSFETLNITSGGTGTNVTIAAGGTYTNTLAGGAATGTSGVGGVGLKLGTNTIVNVSGARNIDLGTVSGTNEAINASTLTGDLKFVETGTASNLSITGGTGANAITVLTGVVTVDISNSTANKDTITFSGDNGPTLASSLTTAQVAQVKGFTNAVTVGDALDITDTSLQANATASAVTTGTYSTGVSFTAAIASGILTLTATGTAKFNDYLTAAENVVAAGKVGAFEYGGNTFVVDHSSSGYSVVELVGMTGVTALSATASGATTILIV